MRDRHSYDPRVQVSRWGVQLTPCSSGETLHTTIIVGQEGDEVHEWVDAIGPCLDGLCQKSDQVKKRVKSSLKSNLTSNEHKRQEMPRPQK